MKINYHRAILTLISFKDRFGLISNKKNESVLNFLKSITLDFEADDSGAPDVTKICEVTQLTRNRVYTSIYESYLGLIESLGSHPLVVNNCIHSIYIRLDDEYIGERKSDKEYMEIERKMTFWGDFRLPVTPRIGEIISLDFLEWSVKYPRGVVTEVHHDIDSECQRIIIYVNPFRNYYWQWNKLKEEFLYDQRNRSYRGNLRETDRK